MFEMSGPAYHGSVAKLRILRPFVPFVRDVDVVACLELINVLSKAELCFTQGYVSVVDLLLFRVSGA